MAFVRMPKLGEDVDEASIVTWIRTTGDTVRRGEVIAEIETEKANVELEADLEGRLRVLIEAGERVAIGTPIATIGDGDDEVATVSPERSEIRPTEGEPAAPARPRPALVEGEEAPDRLRSSPSARNLARELGVDLGDVTGTGPGGRILRADIERAAAGTPPSTAADAAHRPSGRLATARTDARPVLSPIRRATARRMEASKRTIPHFYVTVDVRMDAAIRLLAELDTSEVSITHLLIRAVALAAGEHPRVNASWADGDVVIHPRVDVGLAIALDDGLVSPALIDCGAKSLRMIATETRDLVSRATHGRLTVAELGGGTITVSNLGMFGVDEFVAIVNPPQVAIVAAGAVTERPVVDAGRVVAAQSMRLTCSADHRVLDGVGVARFLTTVRRLLEQPGSLIA